MGKEAEEAAAREAAEAAEEAAESAADEAADEAAEDEAADDGDKDVPDKRGHPGISRSKYERDMEEKDSFWSSVILTGNLTTGWQVYQQHYVLEQCHSDW